MKVAWPIYHFVKLMPNCHTEYRFTRPLEILQPFYYLVCRLRWITFCCALREMTADLFVTKAFYKCFIIFHERFINVFNILIAVQHERGPRNSTIRRQVAMYLRETSELATAISSASSPFRPRHTLPHPMYLGAGLGANIAAANPPPHNIPNLPSMPRYVQQNNNAS